MKERFDKFRAILDREKLDGFLVTSPVNRNYLAGFSGSAGLLVFGPQKTWFLTDSRYTTQAGLEVKGAEVVLQTRFQLLDAAALVKKAGIRRLGFEATHVTVAAHEYLAKELPKVKLVPTRRLVEELRLLKDGRELEALRQAARLADRTFSHILSYIKPGVREQEIATEMEYYMKQQGASGPAFETIVASGWRGALPHGIASEKKIQMGELVVMDFGCTFHHYHSDMTRTVAVGRVGALEKKVYGVVRRAQQAA